METMYWLIAFVILLGIELATMALTTFWFAGGALVACVASIIGIGIEGQLVIFLVVSFGLLFFTRPFLIKYVNRRTSKTNAESLVGKRVKVTDEIDNQNAKGTAVVNGLEWTARAEDDMQIIPKGSMAEVVRIEGVKLIIKKL